MASIKINLKKAQRVILPEGQYPAKVDVLEYRPKGKGGEGEPTLHIEAVTQDCENEEHNGVRLYRDQSMQEQSWWSAVEFLEACGGALEGDDEGDFEFDPEDYIESVVGVNVFPDDTYDGRLRNRVDGFFNLEAAAAEAEAEPAPA